MKYPLTDMGVRKLAPGTYFDTSTPRHLDTSTPAFGIRVGKASAHLAQDGWRPGSKRVLTSNLRKFHWKGQIAKITHEQLVEALDKIESRSARAHASRISAPASTSA